MKKLLLLICLLFITPVQAQEGTTFANFIYEDKAYGASEEINITYELTNPYNKITYNLNYDDKVLELVSATATEEYTVTTTDIVTITREEGTTLGSITFTFKVLENAGQTQITFTNQAGSIDPYGFNAEDHYLQINLKEDNALLNNISFSEGYLTEEFDSNKFEYDLMLEPDITNITVTPITQNIKSTVSGDINEITLNKEQLIINVTSEVGTLKTYTINIKRNIIKSDAYLSRLALDYGYIDFNKDIFEYNVLVPYNVETINVLFTTNHEQSTVEITKEDKLIVGNNLITLKVTDINNNTLTYTINVTRAEYNEDITLSNNNDLISLNIEGYEINFNRNTLNYEILYKDTTLNIEAIADIPTSNISVLGNENLEIGSIIEIIVTAQNGENKTYTITLIAEDITETRESNNNFLYFIIIVIFTVIVIIVIYIIIKNNKIKKELKNKEVEIETLL